MNVYCWFFYRFVFVYFFFSASFLFILNVLIIINRKFKPGRRVVRTSRGGNVFKNIEELLFFKIYFYREACCPLLRRFRNPLLLVLVFFPYPKPGVTSIITAMGRRLRRNLKYRFVLKLLILFLLNLRSRMQYVGRIFYPNSLECLSRYIFILAAIWLC